MDALTQPNIFDALSSFFLSFPWWLKVLFIIGLFNGVVGFIGWLRKR